LQKSTQNAEKLFRSVLKVLEIKSISTYGPSVAALAAVD
jgi:hypothetical protein